MKRKNSATHNALNKNVKKQATLSSSSFAPKAVKSNKACNKSSLESISVGSLELEDSIELSSDEERKARSSTGAISGSQREVEPQVKSILPQIRESEQITHLAAKSHDVSLSSKLESHNQTLPGISSRSGLDIANSLIQRSNVCKASELAVHKKKVEEVRMWLQSSLISTTNHTVLVLTGPAGAGKTACIEALSHDLNYEIVEWHNPMSFDWHAQDSIDMNHESLALKFDRFLSISDKYSPLDFGLSSSTRQQNARTVILVEDIPNTFSSNTGTQSAKSAFQASIRRYLASPRNRYPLVLIVTETEPRGETEAWYGATDAMNIRTLFSRDMLESPNLTQISFNPIGQTFITKALTRIVDSIPRAEGVNISSAVIKAIAIHSKGDIRSAITQLQFIAPSFKSPNGIARARSKKKTGEMLNLTAKEEAILSIVTNREAALGFFHAIGKVIHNKRIPAGLDSKKYDTLPEHLIEHTRLRPENDPTNILDETSTDVPTFLLGIHQNYVESTTSIEQVALVMESLSQADEMTRGFDPGFRSMFQLAGVLGISGTLQALPQNAKRPYSAKIFYPHAGKIKKAVLQFERLLEDYLQAEDSSPLENAPESRQASLLLDRLSFTEQIRINRYGRAKTRFSKLSTMNRFSTFGRGGSDEKVTLLDDDLDTGERSESILAPSPKRQDQRKQTVDLEVMSDEIEEVDD